MFYFLLVYSKILGIYSVRYFTNASQSVVVEPVCLTHRCLRPVSDLGSSRAFFYKHHRVGLLPSTHNSFFLWLGSYRPAVCKLSPCAALSAHVCSHGSSVKCVCVCVCEAGSNHLKHRPWHTLTMYKHRLWTDQMIIFFEASIFLTKPKCNYSFPWQSWCAFSVLKIVKHCPLK